MNQPPNFTIFSIVAGSIFLIVDVFVLAHWYRYCRKHDLNKLWFRVPLLLAVAFLGLNIGIVFTRHFFRMSATDALLFSAVSFWYLPKFPVFFFLVLRDVYQLGNKIVGQLGSKVLGQWGSKTVGQRGSKTVKQQAPVDVSSRRQFIGRAAWGLTVVPYSIVGNGMLKTIHDFKVYHETIDLPNLPAAFNGMRIVQLSDIHAGSFLDHVPFQEAMRLVRNEKPDMILITGDFVNAKPNELSVIARELSKLNAPYGVRGVLGNHDHYNTIEDHKRIVSSVRSLGVDLLINENRRIQTGSESFVLAGIDNTGMKQRFGRVDKALRNVDAGETVILMSHDPTFWDMGVVGKQPVDLTLSGHTHGGQFGVQVLGYEWSPAQYVYKQWAGLYKTGEQQLYVNRGLGTVGPPMRIGMPPEITVLTLRRQQTLA